MQLAGAHVVITGASRGIGRDLAVRFSGRGARVTLVARTEGPLRALAADLGGTAVTADLAEPAGVAGLVDRIEQAAQAPVDVLVNNAGLAVGGPLPAADDAELRAQWEVNAVAPTLLARQALASMVPRGRGSIVFVSSLSAEVALAGLTAYSATKAAVSQLVAGLRGELRGSGVRTLLVELGPVRTDMYDAVHLQPETKRSFDRARRFGLLRDLEPSEVAAAVVAAVEQDRASVVLPRRGRVQWAMSRAPQRVGDLLLRPKA